MRLDEVPELALLGPLRHARGLSSSHRRRYLDGRFGRWHRRNWHTLDWWVPQVPRAASRRAIAPLLAPRPSDRDAWLAATLEQPAGWPQLRRQDHWFYGTPPVHPLRQPAATLSLRYGLLPPWLERLDPHYAHALLVSLGCGLGGRCGPNTRFPASAFVPLWHALVDHRWPVPEWKCRPRAITVRRLGAEKHVFEHRLVECNGAVGAGVLEELSLLARPPGVAARTLPPEPAADAGPGEWIDGVRLLHPRLLWALQRIADEYKWRSIYIYSGYRREPARPKRGSHRSQHWLGRALDLSVEGVDNEELLTFCRELNDMGCGYYPNNKFIHLDVRPRGAGHVLWVDASEPGQPARYVDAWPGVVEGGAMVWAKKPQTP
jgi:hypothetical protein